MCIYKYKMHRIRNLLRKSGESTFSGNCMWSHSKRYGLQANCCDASYLHVTLVQMHFELSVTIMDVLHRASLVWLELKRLQKFQHSDVELTKACGKGEAFSHLPVSHTGSCLHPGETLPSSIIISCHEVQRI